MMRVPLQWFRERLREYNPTHGTYSVDLRVRVVQAVNNDNKPPEEVAKQFRISPAFLAPHQHLTGLGRSVYRYLHLDRDLNDLTPLKGTGRPRLIPTDLEPVLLEQIRANNDLTLEEHCKLWKKRTGMKVSVTCMFESQKRANITLKKATMPVRCVLWSRNDSSW
jgi:transposase